MITDATSKETREQYIAGLAAERRRLGLSQAAVADRIGNVRQTAVSRWETGETIPDVYALAAWADALNVERYQELEQHPKCGTDAGYQRLKRRHGQVDCDRCVNAHRNYTIIYRAARGNSVAA
jgi:transcriptional regulator with XRE-family HTH domain